MVERAMTPTVSVVIAATRFDALKTLLSSIGRHTRGIDYELVIVMPFPVPIDVADWRNWRAWPDRKRLDVLPTWPGVALTLIRDPHQGCVKAFNLGFKAAAGRYVVHLNDDCEVVEGWLANMLKAIGDRDVLGAFTISEPDREGWFVNVLWGKLYANFGCIRRDLGEKLGWWDESFAHYGADPDFAMKVWQKGWTVEDVPDARIIHYCINDENRQEHLREAASTRLVEKWKGIFC
jgi:hypothetical protein